MVAHQRTVLVSSCWRYPVMYLTTCSSFRWQVAIKGDVTIDRTNLCRLFYLRSQLQCIESSQDRGFVYYS